MIYESSYWKNDLLKSSKNLNKRVNQKKWYKRSFVSTEKEIFTSFYAIRKLIESSKLTNTLADKSFSAMSYKSLGKVVTQMNCHNIDELYDFDNERKVDLTLRNICNLIIHSYVFLFNFENEKFNGIYVNSDFSKNKNLYWISLKTISDIFEEVGENYPDSARFTFNQEKNDYDIFLS